MKTQFKIRHDGFNEVRKKIISRTVPIALLAAIGGLTISYFNSKSESLDITFLLIIFPFILVLIGLGLFLGIKRQKDIFNSYTLTIEDENILKSQNLISDIKIHFKDIKEIIKNKDGSFVIKGKQSRDIIGIPVQLENIDELELTLSNIFEITLNDKKTLTQKFPWVLPLAVIVLMIIVYISENKILVGIAGITLVIGLVYSFVVTQRNKQIDRKTKRTMWLSLIVLFSIILVTYVKVID